MVKNAPSAQEVRDESKLTRGDRVEQAKESAEAGEAIC